MSAQERKEASTTAPITPQRPEGGFSRFLRRFFNAPVVPVESQQIQQSVSRIVQPLQELEIVIDNLSTEEAEVKDNAFKPPLPENREPFDLTSEISTFVGIQIKKQEEEKRREERLREETRTKLAAEASAIQVWNEKAREIIITSGVRELIEQVRIGLTKVYTDDVVIGEEGILRTPEPKGYPKKLDYYSDGVFNGRNGGKAVGGYIDYRIRLAWKGQFQYKLPNRTALPNRYTSVETPYGEFNYIDVLSDGKENRLVVKSSDEDRVFEEDGWKKTEELGSAIFEAIKSPCYMQRIPSRQSRGESGSNWLEKMEYRLQNGEHG